LQPPKRQRPVIAIVGANAGSETTDYLMPTRYRFPSSPMPGRGPIVPAR
jgi:hypothetical protein